MNELIKYVSDILNIKTDSVYTIQDMTEELNKVKDIVGYRSYIKDHLDAISYKSGFQKFLMLTKDYLVLEHVALHPEVEAEAVELFKMAKQITFNGKFSDYGDGAIEEIRKYGNAKKIQQLLDDYEFMSYVVRKKMDKPAYEQLPNRMKDMVKQIGK